jgi:PKD repeat protein
MAQDENGVNSSWSTALNITVSQADSGEIPPVADINVSSNASANQTIVFNASGSYDIDGVIVSYQWDFGDGTTGSGVSPEYVYKHPGKYSVTLIVTDNNGNTYSKTMTVNVASEAKEGQSKEQDVLLFHFGIIFVGVIVFIIGVLTVFFIDNVKSFFSEHHIYQFLHRVILHNEYKIEKPEPKIEKTKMSTNTYRGENILPNKITSETNFKGLSIVKMSSHYDEIQKNYIEDGCEDKLSYEGKAFPDYSHEFHTDEKMERIATNGLRPDESSIEIKDSVFSSIRDIELMVDNLILSNIKEKFSIEENDMFDASIDIIRKNIDNMSSKKQE